MPLDTNKHMRQEQVHVLWNNPENASYYRLAMACSPEYRHAGPGQFVSLRLFAQKSPLLRRPFSIHRVIVENGRVSGIEILYKIVGEFTRKLSHAKKGDLMDLLGPLGHGFTISTQFRRLALIAGGIGVAPLVFLAESYTASSINLADSIACIGGKTKTDLLCESAFSALTFKVKTATEDGSWGEKGLVIEPVMRWLKKNRPDMIYACGPMPMLKAVIAMAKLEKIPCEVSVETIMACGVGACLGCAIQTSHDLETYRHACVDGPVFNASALIT